MKDGKQSSRYEGKPGVEDAPDNAEDDRCALLVSVFERVNICRRLGMSWGAVQ